MMDKQKKTCDWDSVSCRDGQAHGQSITSSGHDMIKDISFDVEVENSNIYFIYFPNSLQVYSMKTFEKL